jgi:hypothetical protein
MKETIEKYNHCKQNCQIVKISCAHFNGKKTLFVQAYLTQSGSPAKGIMDLSLLHFRSCSLIFNSDFSYCATTNGTNLSLTDVDKMRRESKDFAEAINNLPDYTSKYSLKD